MVSTKQSAKGRATVREDRSVDSSPLDTKLPRSDLDENRAALTKLSEHTKPIELPYTPVETNSKVFAKIKDLLGGPKSPQLEKDLGLVRRGGMDGFRIILEQGKESGRAKRLMMNGGRHAA